MAATLCIIAPFSLPIFGVIPITAATFLIYLIASLFDMRITVISVLLYIIIGITGLPVFSGFTGGIGVIMSPTGGFVIGYIPMSLTICLIMAFARNSTILQTAALLLGTVILYITGILWFTTVTGAGFKESLYTCIIPFIPVDATKILLTILISRIIKKRIKT